MNIVVGHVLSRLIFFFCVLVKINAVGVLNTNIYRLCAKHMIETRAIVYFISFGKILYLILRIFL
jgi:hypothetical protein